MTSLPSRAAQRNVPHPLTHFRRKTEYRVAYYRATWSSSKKCRRFTRLRDAQRLLANLRAGREDLSPLTYAILEARQIYAGPWREFKACAPRQLRRERERGER